MSRYGIQYRYFRYVGIPTHITAVSWSSNGGSGERQNYETLSATAFKFFRKFLPLKIQFYGEIARAAVEEYYSGEYPVLNLRNFKIIIRRNIKFSWDLTLRHTKRKFGFSVGVINPLGIGIPMGFVTPSPNRPKFNFSVRAISPKGITDESEKLVNSQGNSNFHEIYHTKSKSIKIRIFSWCNKSQGN